MRFAGDEFSAISWPFYVFLHMLFFFHLYAQTAIVSEPSSQLECYNRLTSRIAIVLFVALGDTENNQYGRWESLLKLSCY
jgi:hypothetical protein